MPIADRDIDDSSERAAVLEAGLRETGYDDIALAAPRVGFVARLERMAPDVVLINLGSPSRDTLEDMLAVSRALARPIAIFVDQSDEAMIGDAIDAGVSAYVVASAPPWPSTRRCSRRSRHRPTPPT